MLRSVNEVEGFSVVDRAGSRERLFQLFLLYRLRLRKILLRLQRLAVDFVEGGNIVVPLQQRGGLADAFDGAGVELPDRVEDGMVVRIQRVLLKLRVAGHMYLRNALS